MLKSLLSTLFILMLAGSSLKAQTTVFRDVNVVPMTSETVLLNQTVVVKNDKMVAGCQKLLLIGS